METNSGSNGFSYTYSSEEQEEIRQIREKYETPVENPKEDKMKRLRALDRRPSDVAQIVSLVLGVIGTLILGTGMSLIMTDLGAKLGLGIWVYVIGIAIGLVGGGVAALAYPAYCKVLKAEREKVAPEILSLTEELLK